jgi:hypothetical protein
LSLFFTRIILFFYGAPQWIFLYIAVISCWEAFHRILTVCGIIGSGWREATHQITGKEAEARRRRIWAEQGERPTQGFRVPLHTYCSPLAYYPERAPLGAQLCMSQENRWGRFPLSGDGMGRHMWKRTYLVLRR